MAEYMATYIERERAKKVLAFGVGTTAAEALDNVPAEDVAPVVHGRWIPDGHTVCCSECKTMGSPQWKGCPVCLARMDGTGDV